VSLPNQVMAHSSEQVTFPNARRPNGHDSVSLLHEVSRAQPLHEAPARQG
jgi:hypothetical protein